MCGNAWDAAARPIRFLMASVHLKTLGHPALYGTGGSAVKGLRRKDVALLVYLCVECRAVHARGRLASLLWGESTEERARHSLTQALGRLGRALPPHALVADKEVVRCGTSVECDAVALLRGGVEPAQVDDRFSVYGGPFLEGFDPGAGAEDFREWADRRRAELRNAALRLLERAEQEAAAAGNWSRALRLAERGVEIDPVWEQGHRRLMRAQAACGERNRALRHYQAFEAWLAQEVGAEPDPETRALAEQLRSLDAPGEPADPLPPAAPPSAPPPDPDPEPVAEPPACFQPEPERTREDAPRPFSILGAPLGARVDDTAKGTHIDAAPRGAERWCRRGGSRGLAVPLGITLLILVLVAVAVRGCIPERGAEPVTAGHGENLSLRRSRPGYLAFAEKLYQYPDWATLYACTGMRPVVRRVPRLPDWPRLRLPTVLRHPWMDGVVPVVSDHPADKTAYVAVGCVLAGVPNPATLDSIFGPGALGRMKEVEDSVLRRMPRAFIARGHPVRPAGTLIRAPDGRLRWISFHGGALAVNDTSVLATHCRAPADAVPVSEAEFRYYRAFAALPPSPRGCTEGTTRR